MGWTVNVEGKAESLEQDVGGKLRLCFASGSSRQRRLTFARRASTCAARLREGA